MSTETFKDRTKSTRAVSGFASHFKSRGSSMDGIDAALQAWDNTFFRAKNSTAEQARLIALARLKGACRVYLQNRVNANSALANMRKGVVTELQHAAMSAEAYVGKRANNPRPANGQPDNVVTKALQPAYANERNQFLDDNKANNPYSASAIHGMGNQDTLANFKAVAVQAGGEQVQFMRRDERLKFLLVVENGLLYQNGALYSCPTATPAGGHAIRAATFAMDRYGNLFSKKVAAAANAADRFNHSTYCAGREVICAGTLTCLDGNLLKITNLSGHYAPNANSLRAALILLGQEGVPLNTVAVEGFGCVAGGGFSTASTVVANGTPAAADWIHPYVDPGNGPQPNTIVDYQNIAYDVWEPG